MKKTALKTKRKYARVRNDNMINIKRKKGEKSMTAATYHDGIFNANMASFRTGVYEIKIATNDAIRPSDNLIKKM